MLIRLRKRESDRDFRLLLSDPRQVENLLHENNEPWVDWFDFSTAERFNDDPSVSKVLGQREGVVLWKLRTHDGVEGYLSVAVEMERGVIEVDSRLEEPERATLWRCFRPLIDSKLSEFGIYLSEARSMEEYQATLKKRIEDRSRSDQPLERERE